MELFWKKISKKTKKNSVQKDNKEIFDISDLLDENKIDKECLEEFYDSYKEFQTFSQEQKDFVLYILVMYMLNS